MRGFLTALCLISLLTAPLARAEAPKAPADEMDPRSSVGVILLAGLGGAVFGLSTLSFYKTPEDHIQNIPYGAGLGVIASAIYVTVEMMNAPLPEDEAPKKHASSTAPRLLPLLSPEAAGLALALRF